MGIIHTAKKFVASELMRKKRLLKIEELSREAKTKVTLTPEQEEEVMTPAKFPATHRELLLFIFSVANRI